MKVVTLEEQIRKRAYRELEHEVSKAFNPVERFLQVGHSTDVDGHKEPAHALLSKVKSAILKVHQPLREQIAIDKFMEKVDSLQEQIDGLRDFREES